MIDLYQNEMQRVASISPEIKTYVNHSNRINKISELVGQQKNKVAQLLMNLAFLEHHGMLRLIDIARTRNFDARVLEHIHDEARHALYFHKKANQLTKKYWLISEATTIKSTLFYFNRLYIQAQKILNIKMTSTTPWEQAAAVYFLVVYAIELRGIQLFSEFELASKKYDWGVNFSVLLQDEVGHLDMINKQINEQSIEPTLIQKYLELEARYFNYYLDSLEKSFIEN